MRGLGCRRDNKYKQMVQGSSPVQGKVKLLIKVQTFINKIFSVKTDLQMPKILASTTYKIFFLHKHPTNDSAVFNSCLILLMARIFFLRIDF